MPKMDPHASKKLKNSSKRVMIFFGIIFVLSLVLCYLLQLAGLSPVLNGFIIICFAGLGYLLYLLICAKIDKRREEKQKAEETRDPFSH